MVVGSWGLGLEGLSQALLGCSKSRAGQSWPSACVVQDALGTGPGPGEQSSQLRVGHPGSSAPWAPSGASIDPDFSCRPLLENFPSASIPAWSFMGVQTLGNVRQNSRDTEVLLQNPYGMGYLGLNGCDCSGGAHCPCPNLLPRI